MRSRNAELEEIVRKFAPMLMDAANAWDRRQRLKSLNRNTIDRWKSKGTGNERVGKNGHTGMPLEQKGPRSFGPGQVPKAFDNCANIRRVASIEQRELAQNRSSERLRQYR